MFGPRRALAAFALGAALSVAGIAAFSSDVAAAHGPFAMLTGLGFAGDSGGFRREPLGEDISPRVRHVRVSREGDDGWRRRRHRGERIEVAYGHQRVRGQISLYAVAAKPMSGAQPVCVRLCDGYFFPMSASASSDAASQASACNSQCPDAPTEVYYLNGSDKIDDAISSTGQPYTALPVAMRYRTTFDNTCSCHRDAIAYAPLDDASLKKGDVVMTPAGVVVFNGVEGGAHKAGDFTALAGARLPADQRNALQAMERVSLDKGHPTLKDWLTSQGPGRTRDAVAEVRPITVARGEDRIRLLSWRGGAAQD